MSTVDDEVNEDFNTIQAAVDAASDGDKIIADMVPKRRQQLTNQLR